MLSIYQRPLVNLALQLWSTTRLIEKTWTFCGTETLGMEPVTDVTNPWLGTVPVTPIMDQQLDQIVIRHFLVPLKNKLLVQLEKAVIDDTSVKRRWFEIFLVKFILLHNIEVQLAHSRQFAKRYGMTVD